MISVKSTKGEDENPDPAAPYAERPVEKPRGLAKAGAWLVAVAVYLKAVMSGNGEAAVPDGKGEPRVKKATRPLSEAEGDKPDRDGFTPERPGKSDDNSLQALLNADPRSDTIEFPTGERGVESPVFKPMAYVPFGANVNDLPDRPWGPGPGRFGKMSDTEQVGPPKSKRPQEAPVKTPVKDREPDPTGDTPSNDIPSDSAPSDDDPGETESPGEPTEEDPGEEEDGSPEDSNRAPRVTGPVFLRDIHACAILPIGLSDLLRGATDPDGDELHVENVSTSTGQLIFHQDGHWEFTSGGEAGPVEISYLVSDGSLSVQQTLRFEVTPTHGILGTEGDDILLGTMCDDEIQALAGDDLIDARDGNDLIWGGAGDDHIIAGSGNDWVHGGPGNDIIFGGTGNDILEGGRGNDRLFGGKGNDTLRGDQGDDYLEGGDGDDNLSGGQGDDRIFGGTGRDLIFGGDGADMVDAGDGDDFVDGGAGNDVLRGGSGNDRITGGDGNDRLVGGDGASILLGEAGDDLIEDGRGEDTVNGGAGDDIVVATPDGVSDHYDGGEGFDRIDYSAASEDLVIDLASGHASGIEIGHDTISGFEHVTAGAGNDLIRFGVQPVTVAGGAGQNRFEFATDGAWDDFFEGGHDPLRMEILDFKVGDHLKLSKWDILRRADDEPEDYEDIVSDTIPSVSEMLIRYRWESMDDMVRTILEANLNGDDSYEVSFALSGHHSLTIHENTC